MKNVDNFDTLPHGDQLDESAVFAESQDHPKKLIIQYTIC